VAGVGVERGTNNGQLVHDPGLLGQVLTDANTGHVRVDRPEFAADLGGRIRLQIVHVDVAGTARQPDQNDGLAIAL
jgi:hypothetical protein